MNPQFFEQRIKEIYQTKTAFAEELGITLGSLSDWFSRGVIPSRRINEVLGKLNIQSEKERCLALGLPLLETSYRAKFKDLDESEVPPAIQENTRFISKIFFSLISDYPKTSSLESLWSEIGAKRDPYYVATLIRKAVDITDTTPFDFGAVNYILEKYGINVFLVPFGAFNLRNDGDENRPLAFTSRFGDQYFILCDSDRTMDEVAFDLTHELVHIFTALIGGSINRDDEDFIDHVTEELIYPKLFIEREMGEIFRKKRISKEDFLKNGFRKMIANYDFFAPRGVARTLRRLDHLNSRQPVFHWMNYEEHEYYLTHVVSSVSKSGNMDFDFSDVYELETFIEDRVIKDPRKYPLFYQLCKGLAEKKLTPRAFSKIFGIDSGEADELGSEWRGKFKVNLGL